VGSTAGLHGTYGTRNNLIFIQGAMQTESRSDHLNDCATDCDTVWIQLVKVTNAAAQWFIPLQVVPLSLTHPEVQCMIPRSTSCAEAISSRSAVREMWEQHVVCM
jgi:hypothetical protein